ncbi:hypothetical protein WH47_12550 [Habropoda laboriosa]|uniref:Pheromone-binding protein-related protein 1 n=1 Tax=Habropoda laboriosa TaxID=597456 RepID=A0A0L7R080_9HYME|nr:hypothetical protein WH47_12550 [Habropoda laboriosa]
MASTIFQGLLSENFLELPAKFAGFPLESLPECIDRANMTSAELRKLHDSPEERIKMINGDGDFRKFGCFVACVFQKIGLMTGSALNSQTVSEFIESKHDGNLDMVSFVSKMVEVCASDIEETDNECDVALAFRVCLLKAMRTRD